MGAGAEGQARIEQQVDRFRLRRSVPARHDPQATAEAHRLEVVHPAAFPVLVLDALDLVLRQFAAGEQLQMRDQRRLVGIRLEQRQQVGVRPQRGGTEVRLEDRLVFGVHEGHRDGADFQQSVFVLFRLFGGDGESDLYPGHAITPEIRR
ncbi:hypothetical protein D9M71_510200 [compost metagenome]